MHLLIPYIRKLYVVTGLRLATAEIRREEPPLNDEEMAGEQVLPSN